MAEARKEMEDTPEIKWNKEVKLVLSDVDETVADVYTPATPEMITQLNDVLADGVSIFFVSGGGLQSIQERVTDQLDPKLRKSVLIAHCSGAEVWGFNQEGSLKDKPFYSVYEEQMSADQKQQWRRLVQQLIAEFNLKIFPAMPVSEFKQKAGNDPLAVILSDRGPQITFEFINAYDLKPEQASNIHHIDSSVSQQSYDLRIPVLEKAEQLFKEAGLPIGAKLGGVFALDFPVAGISKEHAVRYVLESDEVLRNLGLSKEAVHNPQALEIWGDKYSVTNGGTDRHMSLAVNPKVRSVDFREEDPKEFPEGLNIQIWRGENHLHEGLLKYLQGRKLA